MKKAIISGLILSSVALSCKDKATTPPEPVVPLAIVTPDNGDQLTDSQVIEAAVGSGYSFPSVDFYIDNIMVFSDSAFPYQYYWNIFEYDPDIVHPIYVEGLRSDTTYRSDAILVTLDFQQGFSYAGTYQPGSQNALGVVNYFNVVFVSMGDAGLEMLDVRNRTAPQFLARFDTPGQALHADVSFPVVLIADRDQGVTAADFSDIDSMMFVATFNTQSLAVDVAASENVIFVAENDALSVLQFDGDHFSSHGRLSLSNDILRYLVARHDTSFVVGNSGFYIIDASRDLIGSYDNLTLARAVAVSDTFAFIANGADGVIALSIENPANPRFLARFNPGQIMVAVDAGDGVLFAGVGNGTVYAIDYGTSGQLNVIDQFGASNLLEEIDYESNYLYVAAHTNVDILRFVR
jgi:hypothetical protein